MLQIALVLYLINPTTKTIEVIKPDRFFQTKEACVSYLEKRGMREGGLYTIADRGMKQGYYICKER